MWGQKPGVGNTWTPSTGKDVGQQSPSFVAGGNAK